MLEARCIAGRPRKVVSEAKFVSGGRGARAGWGAPADSDTYQGWLRVVALGRQEEPGAPEPECKLWAPSDLCIQTRCDSNIVI